MDFTGERFVPGVQGPMKLEHLQRYACVERLARGRRVADIACGEGYGAAILARHAARVVGIDISAAAAQHARQRYRAVRNLAFAAGRCEALPLATGSVDLIVSFETIEHLEDHEACLSEFRRILAPDGRLAISTPDPTAYVTAKHGNPFHVRELTFAEFKALLDKRFATVRFWGQRPAVATFTYALDNQPAPVPVWRALRVDGDNVSDGVAALPAPAYIVGVASDAPLDDVSLETVIIEPADDAYAALTSVINAYQEECGRLEGVRAAEAETYRQQAEALHGQAEALRGETQVLRGEAQVLRSEISALGNDKVLLARERDRQRELAAEAARERDVVLQSKSWRLTAPLRDFRYSVAQRKHAAALWLERHLRAAFRRLPLRGQSRWALKTAVFERTGWLMRGTASYQHWHGTQRRARSAANPAVRAAARQVPNAEIRLATSAEPAVSIIIPAYGQVDLTRACLASIAAHPPAVPYEVILVDDASPEDLGKALAGVDGLIVVRNQTNAGFIHTCNRGARESRGRYLCFLNNDTEVTRDWCDELLATLTDVAGAGLVGAKLVYPDGSLQEAGGIIWKDGSGWNVGRFDDPARPEHSYRRDVDYVSGAAIMIPAGLFWELGGFDAHYAPAYGEDSDLAFKVRAAGRRVIVQPLSVVIHHEGATAGTDLSSGVKSHQVQNQQRLAARWASELESHFAPGEQVRRARERGIACRALVLDLCTPEPDKDAGSITAFNIMDILQRLGCGITFAPVDNFLFLDRYTTALQRRGIECLYAPFVTSIEDYLSAHGGDFDLVLIFRFVTATRHLEAVRRFAPRAKVWLHTSDLHFLREIYLPAKRLMPASPSSAGPSKRPARPSPSRPGATSRSSAATSIRRTSTLRCTSRARYCPSCAGHCPTCGFMSSGRTRPITCARWPGTPSRSPAFCPNWRRCWTA
jgi:GT2 family glycosyltransferase/SAM-dependent methyltransferase